MPESNTLCAAFNFHICLKKCVNTGPQRGWQVYTRRQIQLLKHGKLETSHWKMSKRKRRTARAESCPWRVLPGGLPLSWSSLGYPCPGPSWGVPLSWSWPGGGGTSILEPDLTTPPPPCPQPGPGQWYPQKGPGTRGWEGTWDQTLGYPRKYMGPEMGTHPSPVD